MDTTKSNDALVSLLLALRNGPMTMQELTKATGLSSARVYDWVMRAYRNGFVGRYPPGDERKGNKSWRYYALSEEL